MEKAPTGITKSFSMLFLIELGGFPEKFSLGIFFPLQNLILFAYRHTCAIGKKNCECSYITFDQAGICYCQNTVLN